MANVKISQLPAASALIGSEVLPVVQSGATKKTTINEINNSLTPDVTIEFTGEAPSTINFLRGFQNNYVNTYNISSPIILSNKVSTDLDMNVAAATSSLNFPDLYSVNVFGIYMAQYLTTVTFPALRNSTSPTFAFNDCTQLSSITFPVFEEGGMLYGFNIPLITAIDSTMYPVLTRTFGVSAYLNNYTTIDLPNLNYIQPSGIYVESCTNLTTVNLPNIIENNSTTSPNSVYVSDCINLTSFTCGTIGITKKFIGANNTFYIINCGLNQASVDGLFTLLASLDGTNGTTSCDNGVLNITGGTSASPSATGLAAKAILLSRGWTVSNN